MADNWWYCEGQRAPELEFSRRNWWYERPDVYVTKTEQGWMIDRGAPSVGTFMRNKMTPAGGQITTFNIGPTLGM